MLTKVQDIKVGNKLRRIDTGEIVELKDIYIENYDYNLYIFFGFIVNKKILLKFFENDGYGNVYVI